METASALGSLYVPFARSASKHPSFFRALVEGQRLVPSKWDQKGSLYSGVRASGAISALKSDADKSQKISENPVQKKNVRNSTFPNGFENLILEVCDETDVAELKLKAGDFEMHLKRELGTSQAPISFAPATASPAPRRSTVESASSAPPVPPKAPSVTSSPFTNVSSAKASKLAALETSGSKSYVLVPSPTVGSFCKGRTLKGKKLPPSCKEGDVIKEGQIIGYIDQFGTELPVRSDAAGEVLKVLFEGGEAVGYGDPLIALLPSFRGIK